MKKIQLLFVSLLIAHLGISQTTLFSEDFESGNAFTLNTADLGASTTFNTWLVNNSYTGGSGTFTCLGFPFSFTVANTPQQPAGITGAPTSNYMHITAQAAITSGINCAAYIPAEDLCVTSETNFSKMTASISTSGLTGITFNCWWMCAGSANAYGEIYYSLDNGSNWILKQSNLNNQSNWTQASFTDVAWDNQPSLQFAFRFVNSTSTTGADPAFSVDEITITQDCLPTSSVITETACDSYTSPSGNYVWTESNTYMDTIPNAANCDSVITINLTVTNSSSSTITETACDSYTSPSGNYIWTESSTYMDTIPNAANCDSIITINLTVTNSSSATITETACDSYTSPSGNYVWTESNTYLDTIPNAAGCDSVMTINLIIDTVDNSVAQNGAVLTANESGATYQWVACPSLIPIDNATDQSYVATINGDYAVIVSSNGCTDTSECYTVLTVGVFENSFGHQPVLYPNPTNGNFSIDLGERYASVRITLADLSGKIIQSNEYAESQLLFLNIEEPAGTYLLHIESADKKAVIRLVKE